jgi:hypothetical protein
VFLNEPPLQGVFCLFISTAGCEGDDMTNRRELLQAGIALSTLSAAGIAEGRSSQPNKVDAVLLDGLVFDSRFKTAIEVAKSAVAYGASRHEINGDGASIWRSYLRPLWRGPHAALAGITTSDEAFVIQILAADHGLRVIYSGVHQAPAGGFVAHDVAGPDTLIDVGLGGDGRFWTHRVGYLLTHCPMGTSVKAAQFSTPADLAADRRRPLISWIVAPASWKVPALAVRPMMHCGGMYAHTQA